jgi:adenylylsulfate kinase-like enzyme
MIIYFFGQPGSGKTTLAQFFAEWINNTHRTNFYNYCMIDGDILRTVFNDHDYSKAGRVRNIQRAMDIALYQAHAYERVICSLVTPFNFQRIWLQQQGKKAIFVYLTYNVDNNRGRESFHVKDFEEPSGLDNLLRLNTSELTPAECLAKITDFYTENKIK